MKPLIPLLLVEAKRGEIDTSTPEARQEAKKSVIVAIRSVFSVLMSRIDQGQGIKLADFRQILQDAMKEAATLQAVGNETTLKAIENENNISPGGAKRL